MSYTTYEFTAYTEADLLAAGAEGHSVSCGDTFTMSGTATTCFEVSDNDAFLSGDNYCNENANDHYGQQASITGETGQEIGNGGQIYAEKYFWVCDDAGNWYVMINIEQEGSGEDYFTFYTGHGYTVPEEGTELTVYSSSNVKGSWIDFKDLDAGEKGPDTGSISGRVFNDEDCDGIDGGVTVIEGSDYTIEAEDMDAWGFKTVQGAYASGGELVKLQSAGQSAAIKTDFQGKDGVYDVSLFIQDETDGKSKIKLLVNGQVVEAIRLDRQSDGVGSNNGGFSEFVVEGVELKAGDEVKIWAEGDGYEFVRIDKLEFNGRDQEVRTEEAGKEGVVVVLLDTDGNEVLDGNGDRIETVTDANGEYTFDGVPVGDYRVKFENPDGTEFTFQNAGSDDAIDSDVNGNGVSDVISVVADQTTSDVDAGLKPAAPLPASLSGTYFCDDDGDGVDDGAANGDADVAGKIVMLFEADGMTPASDINGDPIAAQTTDGQGNYSFENLAAGDYVVMFADSLDEGKTFVLQDVGGNDAIDSDVNAISGKTGVISLAAGENKTDVDAGVEEVDPGNAGECAFFIEGPVLTKVTLEEQPDGSIKVTVDVLDSTGQIGDLRGFFFETADESLLSQLSITGADVGEVKIDANNVTNVGNGVNLNGEVVKNFGAFDVGVEIGTPGASPDDIRSTMFTISHAGGQKLEADDFSFTDFGIRLTSVGEEGGSREDSLKIGGSAPLIICEKPGAVSGTYFCDDNRDGDDDGDATGDKDVAGKTVTLLNADGTAVFDADGNMVQPVLTDTTGDYRFDNIPAGDYIVMFEAVAGKEFIAPNAADDAVDSDVTDVANGKTDVITVVDGIETKDVDAGVQDQLGSLSGRYFCDDNRDGLDNDGLNNGPSDGVAGILVELLGTGGDPLDTVMTGPDGEYSFVDLLPGTYGVRFSGTPADKTFTIANANMNGNDDIDSDAIVSDIDQTTAVISGINVFGGQDTPDNDAGVFPNQPPVVDPDMAKGCADELIFVDFSDNFSDPDAGVGDTASITAIDGQAISQGQTISVAIMNNAGQTKDVSVSLTAGDQFIFDGEDAFAFLDIGEEETESFTVTVTDSVGASSQANIDVTFCGDANSVESFNAALPNSASYQVVQSNLENPVEPHAFDLKLSNTGDMRFDGVIFEQAYCVSAREFVDSAETFDAAPILTGDLYSFDEVQPDFFIGQQQNANANGLPAFENLDIIEWILNQDFENAGPTDIAGYTGDGFSGWEVQLAIWEFTENFDADLFTDFDPGYGNIDDTDFIISQALANGEGFEAGVGDIHGVFLQPNPSPQANSQPLVFGLDWEAYDCLC